MQESKRGKTEKAKAQEKAFDGKVHEPKPIGLVVCEHGMAEGKSEYAEKLTKAMDSAFCMLPPVHSGREVWRAIFKNIPSVLIVSHTLRDVDALNLINLLRLSDYCDETMFFLCVKRLNKSVMSICSDQKLDGVFSFAAPISKTADKIAEKYYTEIDELRKKNFERLMKKHGDISILFDIERSRINLEAMLNDVLLPLGLSKAHKGTEYACLMIIMKLLNINKPMAALYELAALYYNTTAAAVEKSLRYAIERAWTIGDICMQQIIFGNTVDESKGKPTNSEFIFGIYEHIRYSLNGTASLSKL